MAQAQPVKDDHPDGGCGLKVVDRDIFINLPFLIICIDLCRRCAP